MNSTHFAHQMAAEAAGARPCAFTFGRQRWILGVPGVDLIAMKSNVTASTALGSPPV
jgi:hypothetical protein